MLFNTVPIIQKLWRKTRIAAIAAPLALIGVCIDGFATTADQPEIVMVSAFDPFASGILLDGDIVVTNRHVLSDQTKATITKSDGKTYDAVLIPTAFPGDLVLLGIEGATFEPDRIALPTVSPSDAEEPFRVIGMDIGTNRARTYGPSSWVMIPSAGYLETARIHSDAEGQPGNSGGALIDARGQLVGIIASGGEGLIEAVPANRIKTLMEQSGPEYTEASQVIGDFYEACNTALDRVYRMQTTLPRDQAEQLLSDCVATGNRQFMDLAGQSLGRLRHLDLSEQALAKALELDPNGPNTLLSMAITLHLMRAYDREIPLLRRLLDIKPRDPQVLRLAIQAGKFGDDPELSEQAYDLLETHHPKLAPLARAFLDGRPPPPSTGQ